MTKVSVRLLPSADADYSRALDFLSDINPELGRRFAVAFTGTIEQLAAMPGIGRPGRFRHFDAPSLRIWRVDEFPEYLVFYEETETEVRISRVLHSARNIDRILNDDE